MKVKYSSRYENVKLNSGYYTKFEESHLNSFSESPWYNHPLYKLFKESKKILDRI